MRLQQSLAGNWAFQLDPEGQVQHDALQTDRTIPVPMPWQAVFPELERYSGYAWYQRTFTLDESWLQGEILLDFGAVDYWCQVYINGQYIGEHEGGYTPFRFPIRQCVRAGENELSVYVYDSVQSEIVIPRWRDDAAPERTQPPFDPTLIPHGKQTWYIDASGIWQDVTLTAVPKRYIDAVHITPDIHTGSAHVRVALNGTGSVGTLRVTLDGHTVGVPADGQHVELTIRVDNPRLWTPDTPTLYTAAESLHAEGNVDQV